MRHGAAPRTLLASVVWLGVAAGACASFTAADAVSTPDGSTDAALDVDAPSESGSADGGGVEAGAERDDADAGPNDADATAQCKGLNDTCSAESGCCTDYACNANGVCQSP